MIDVIVVLVIALCLLGMTLLVVHQRHLAMARKCIDNLRLIDGAKERWAFETYNATNPGAPVSLGSSLTNRIWENCFSNTTPAAKDIVIYITQYTDELHCPRGGTYTIGRIGVVPTCSIPGHALPP
jgi:hypothetical protein